MTIARLLAHPKRFRRVMSWYPPFLGTGISIAHVSHDYRQVRVIMKSRFYNINAFGVHFGGSMSAMTDPFFTLMLQQILGKRYRVIDSSSCITFLKQGRGTLLADHQITERDLSDIAEATEDGQKYFKEFAVAIRDDQDDVVASVEKRVYVRLRRQFRSD